MCDTSQALPAELLMIQLLEWVAARPRCYAEVMEAWRTSCPRLPVWEAALEADLLRVEHASGTAMGACMVTLTGRGRDVLAGEGRTDPRWHGLAGAAG
jgi:hypothetical protein